MTKKLEDLYTSDSLHEGVWKKIKGAWDSESNAKPLPERPPEPKHPQPAHVVRKAAPPMPSKEDGGPDYVKAGLTGLVAGSLLGPLGAVAGGAIGGQIFRKKTK